MNTQNLVIDVGNTFLKWGVFENHTLVKNGSIAAINQSQLKSELDFLAKASSHCFISGSAVLDNSLLNYLQKKFQVFFFDQNTKLPFSISYKTPLTLGLDRKANVAAASSAYVGKNCIIIDAGTCVTYDFLTANGVYLGGAISPGLQMRFKAMHTFTAKLPLIDIEDEMGYKNYTGTTTSESMKIGVIEAMCHEIDGFIQQYLNDYEDLTIIFTGGDALYLSTRLKNSIFVDLNFQLKGLYTIFEYHKANA